jgi:hypothetical protein
MKLLKRLELNFKTGFWNTGNAPIVILDEFKRPFYDTTFQNRIKNFNLPAGEYYVVSGRFQKMANPVEFPLSPLPKIERKMDDPENFTVKYLNNPKVATILWDEHKIVLDTQLRNLPLSHLVFILYHEYGHRYYDTNESACDAYAKNRMLKEGYNPEQIADAIASTLSNTRQGLHRKVEMINSLT